MGLFDWLFGKPEPKASPSHKRTEPIRPTEAPQMTRSHPATTSVVVNPSHARSTSKPAPSRSPFVKTKAAAPLTSSHTPAFIPKASPSHEALSRISAKPFNQRAQIAMQANQRLFGGKASPQFVSELVLSDIEPSVLAQSLPTRLPQQVDLITDAKNYWKPQSVGPKTAYQRTWADEYMGPGPSTPATYFLDQHRGLVDLLADELHKIDIAAEPVKKWTAEKVITPALKKAGEALTFIGEEHEAAKKMAKRGTPYTGKWGEDDPIARGIGEFAFSVDDDISRAFKYLDFPRHAFSFAVHKYNNPDKGIGQAWKDTKETFGSEELGLNQLEKDLREKAAKEKDPTERQRLIFKANLVNGSANVMNLVVEIVASPEFIAGSLAVKGSANLGTKKGIENFVKGHKTPIQKVGSAIPRFNPEATFADLVENAARASSPADIMMQYKNMDLKTAKEIAKTTDKAAVSKMLEQELHKGTRPWMTPPLHTTASPAAGRKAGQGKYQTSRRDFYLTQHFPKTDWYLDKDEEIVRNSYLMALAYTTRKEFDDGVAKTTALKWADKVAEAKSPRQREAILKQIRIDGLSKRGLLPVRLTPKVDVTLKDGTVLSAKGKNPLMSAADAARIEKKYNVGFKKKYVYKDQYLYETFGKEITVREKAADLVNRLLLGERAPKEARKFKKNGAIFVGPKERGTREYGVTIKFLEDEFDRLGISIPPDQALLSTQFKDIFTPIEDPVTLFLQQAGLGTRMLNAATQNTPAKTFTRAWRFHVLAGELKHAANSRLDEVTRMIFEGYNPLQVTKFKKVPDEVFMDIRKELSSFGKKTDWQLVGPGDVNFIESATRFYNNHMFRDPAMKAYLKEGIPDEANLLKFLDTPGGKRILDEVGLKAGQYTGVIRAYHKYFFGDGVPDKVTEILQKALKNGKLTRSDAKALARKKAGIMVPGQIPVGFTLNSKMINTIGRIENSGYYLLQKAGETGRRQVYLQSYKRELKRLQKLAKQKGHKVDDGLIDEYIKKVQFAAMGKPSRGLTDDALAMLQKESTDAVDFVAKLNEDKAHKYAMSEVHRILYDWTNRTNDVAMAKGLMPFYQPYREMYVYWAERVLAGDTRVLGFLKAIGQMDDEVTFWKEEDGTEWTAKPSRFVYMPLPQKFGQEGFGNELLPGLSPLITIPVSLGMQNMPETIQNTTFNAMPDFLKKVLKVEQPDDVYNFLKEKLFPYSDLPIDASKANFIVGLVETMRERGILSDEMADSINNKASWPRSEANTKRTVEHRRTSELRRQRLEDEVPDTLSAREKANTSFVMRGLVNMFVPGGIRQRYKKGEEAVKVREQYFAIPEEENDSKNKWDHENLTTRQRFLMKETEDTFDLDINKLMYLVSSSTYVTEKLRLQSEREQDRSPARRAAQLASGERTPNTPEEFVLSVLKRAAPALKASKFEILVDGLNFKGMKGIDETNYKKYKGNPYWKEWLASVRIAQKATQEDKTNRSYYLEQLETYLGTHMKDKKVGTEKERWEFEREIRRFGKEIKDMWGGL